MATLPKAQEVNAATFHPYGLSLGLNLDAT